MRRARFQFTLNQDSSRLPALAWLNLDGDLLSSGTRGQVFDGVERLANRVFDVDDRLRLGVALRVATREARHGCRETLVCLFDQNDVSHDEFPGPGKCDESAIGHDCTALGKPRNVYEF
jgi:hypothetical protein